ncbi:acid phosphatase [Chitinimonas sp.]|uniref:acid phosphatase n=1 Tax=Chitinimonas sp. TaxID=1934313 RepID=UPI0035B1BBDE
MRHLLLLAGLLSASPLYAAPLDKIHNIVVIYGENRSFDSLYGLYPGADGLLNLKPAQYLQTDRDGTPFSLLPPIWHEDRKQASAIDPMFAAQPQPANKPFRIDAPPYGIKLGDETRDQVHRFYQSQMQINGGKMDRFAAWSDGGALVMGHYDGSQMKLWQLARRFTLADQFFMGAFGGSFLNHMWLACACTPSFPDAPAKLRSVVEDDGITLKQTAESPKSALQGPPVYVADKSITPDGFAVNTMQPSFQPSGIAPASDGDTTRANPAQHPLPVQTAATLGDRLSAKGVSWAWFGAAWNQAVADGPLPDAQRRAIYHYDGDAQGFNAHHQPYNYFANYAPGSAARSEHLKDGEDFERAIGAGTLPQVSFYKPAGKLNQHPGGDLAAGDAHIAGVVERIMRGPQWKNTLIIVTYDENGGFWDHVAPPKGDRWGPGPRVPTLLISPWVKKGFVDHTVYDTTSIHRLINRRFGLDPLPGVRAFGDLTAALTSGQGKRGKRSK